MFAGTMMLKDISDSQHRQKFSFKYTHNTPPHPTYHLNQQKQNSPPSRRSTTSLSKCVDNDASCLLRSDHLTHIPARIHNNLPHTPARIRNATISPQILTSLPSPRDTSKPPRRSDTPSLTTINRARSRKPTLLCPLGYLGVSCCKHRSCCG